MKNIIFKNNYSSNSSNNSNSNYETGDSGSEKYPKNSENSEYYLYKHKIPIFATNRYGEFYYAKDSKLNEFYPTYKGINIYAFQKDGKALIAKLHSGRERYPSSNWSGEYYPVNQQGIPFYLKTENNLIYPAKNTKNVRIYLQPPILDKKHVRKRKDALNNTVYLAYPKIQSLRIPFDIWASLLSITCPLILLSIFAFNCF